MQLKYHLYIIMPFTFSEYESKLNQNLIARLAINSFLIQVLQQGSHLDLLNSYYQGSHLHLLNPIPGSDDRPQLSRRDVREGPQPRPALPEVGRAGRGRKAHRLRGRLRHLRTLPLPGQSIGRVGYTSDLNHLPYGSSPFLLTLSLLNSIAQNDPIIEVNMKIF